MAASSPVDGGLRKQGMPWMTSRRCRFFEKRFSFPWRVLFYLVPWLGAVAVFLVCNFPESPLETDLSPLQQAFVILLETPVLVSVGPVHLLAGEDGGRLAAGVAALVFFAHAGFALSRQSVVALIFLFMVEVVLVGIGVGGFVHFVVRENVASHAGRSPHEASLWDAICVRA
jgi:hypothetical protein